MARPLQDEADPMREYDDDDNIRLYAPVLQRVIILAAVVIAVPVMMWTITTFIRSYVARPQVPTFQHLTLTDAAQNPPPESPLTATPPLPRGAQPAQPAPTAALADTNMTASGNRAPSTDTGSLATAPATAAPSAPPVPTMAAAAVDNPAQTQAPNPPAMASPDAGGMPTVAKPAGLVARLATNGSATSPPAPAAAPAWPNPSAGGPPSFGAEQPPDAMTDTASTEALPPPQPIKGRIPMPRRRPAAIALAATEDVTPPAAVADTAATETAATETAATDALPPPRPIKGRVPLPRRRPAVLASLATTGSVAPPMPTGRAVPMPKMRPVAAPPDASPAPVGTPYGYEPGLDSGR
jgi:hypothetical protein